MDAAPLCAYLVDDEPLALERLRRLLAGFEQVTIWGAASDAVEALRVLSSEARQIDRRSVSRHPDARHDGI